MIGSTGRIRAKPGIAASDYGKTAQGRAALLFLYGCAFISSTRLNGAKTRTDLFLFFTLQPLNFLQ
jgi:hypothetical protein